MMKLKMIWNIIRGRPVMYRMYVRFPGAININADKNPGAILVENYFHGDLEPGSGLQIAYSTKRPLKMWGRADFHLPDCSAAEYDGSVGSPHVDAAMGDTRDWFSEAEDSDATHA